MKARILSKIIVSVLFGILIGIVTHSDYVKRGQLGRDHFLAAQGARFDRFFANPSPIVVDLIVGVVCVGLLFGIYELLVFCCSKVLERFEDAESN